PFAHEVSTTAQQIAGGAHLGWVNISHRDHAAAQQDSDFLGIDFIVFGFAAMDGFHVKRVAQDELDSFLRAQIGQPVPAEDAFDGHDQVLAVGFDGFEESLGTGAEVTVQQNLPLGIEDTEIHPAGMQVDAAVIAVTLGIESHQVSSSWKLDTSRSISNRYAPRGGLDEYHFAGADAPQCAGTAQLNSVRYPGK